MMEAESHIFAKVAPLQLLDLRELRAESLLTITFFVNESAVNSINRSFKSLVEFYSAIRKSHSLPATMTFDMPTTLVNSVTAKLERYLNGLFDILGDSFWNDADVIQFIDEGAVVSHLTMERLRHLNNMVIKLEHQIADSTSVIKQTEEAISQLNKVSSNKFKVLETLLGEDNMVVPMLDSVEQAKSTLFALRRNLPHQNSVNSQISCETDKETVSVIGNSSDGFESTLPGSTFLSGELLSIILKNGIYEDAIEDILKVIDNPNYLTHISDLNFLANQLQVIPHLRIFDIGLHSIGFSLVHDEVKLLIYADHVSAEPIEKTLSNLFRSISHNSLGATQKKQYKDSMSEVGQDFDGTDYSIAFNPQHQKAGTVTGMLNVTPFTIVFQDNRDATLLLMFEEFNRIVGKNDLFKKSVMLIRSWWIHESIIYVGATIKHYLPNNAFIVMVLSIFNRFHQHINTPFQALCLFLADFSLFNPAVHLVTIDGFFDVTTHQELHRSNDLSLLVESHFVAKYRDIISLKEHEILDLALIQMTSGVYIANPLDGSNMAIEKLTANQVIRLTKALQNGAANLAVFIRQLDENNLPKQGQLIKNFFPNIVSSFGGAATNEIRVNFGKSCEEMRKELLSCISYGNFVAHGHISKEALVAITVSILQDQGGLRTSDIIGEMMLKVSSLARDRLMQTDILTLLTAALREKCSDLFVIVEDNPVDPYIILQETLTPQQLGQAARGVAPIQALIQSSKANASNSKFNQQCDSFMPNSFSNLNFKRPARGYGQQGNYGRGGYSGGKFNGNGSGNGGSNGRGGYSKPRNFHGYSQQQLGFNRQSGQYQEQLHSVGGNFSTNGNYGSKVNHYNNNNHSFGNSLSGNHTSGLFGDNSGRSVASKQLTPDVWFDGFN